MLFMTFLIMFISLVVGEIVCLFVFVFVFMFCMRLLIKWFKNL